MPLQQSQSDLLRVRRLGSVINSESKIQEADLQAVVSNLFVGLQKDFPDLKFQYEKRLKLKEIIKSNTFDYEVEDSILEASFLNPDGGFIYLTDKNGAKYPILISEVKKQGTNDIREAEGKAPQAKGNAIERLGKNVLGFKVLLNSETIFPFACFCYGRDFEEGSSIRDRVATIASFARLNTIHLEDSVSAGTKLGSYFVRELKWTNEEMAEICNKIAKGSIRYYTNKYGQELFSSSLKGKLTQ